jgi:Fe-S cluster assembly protein SufD
MGWIPARSESFRHLPPPGAEVWLGSDTTAPFAADGGWTVHCSPLGHPDRVHAQWLDARVPEQRTELLGVLPQLGERDVDRFAWAHRAVCRDGLRLRIGGPRDTETSDETVSLVLRHTPRAAAEAPLLAVEVEAGARCELIEFHQRGANGAATVQNLELRIRVGRGATLRHVRVALPASADSVAQRAHVRLDEGAQYRQALIAAGSRYHLQRTEFDLPSIGAQAHIGAALFAAGSALEQQVEASHAAERSDSAVESLLLASGTARGVVNAFSRIAPGCDEASVRQRLSGIPTGGRPKLVLRPHLEIHHDKVQAAHGATWGALPEDALFYARQRGLDERAAHALILEGMANALLERALGAPDRMTALGLDAVLARAVANHLRGNAETTDG